MLNRNVLSLAISVWTTLLFGVSLASAAGVTGAKALFFSESGATISASSTSAEKPKTVAKSSSKEKFTGVAYQLAQMDQDGQFRIVPKSHVFGSGDRVKFLVRSNHPGYLTVLNVGTSGMTHVLFSNYVQAMAITEVPQGNNLQFVGSAGVEKIIMMLSSGPNPIGTPGGSPNQAPAMNEANSGSNATYASLEGSKDLVLEDNLKTKYAVISPKNNYRPVAGTKDMVLETDSSSGYNYGVVPAAAISGGGILTLETTLRHR